MAAYDRITTLYHIGIPRIPIYTLYVRITHIVSSVGRKQLLRDCLNLHKQRMCVCVCVSACVRDLRRRRGRVVEERLGRVVSCVVRAGARRQNKVRLRRRVIS